MKIKTIALLVVLCCPAGMWAQLNMMDYFTNPNWHECQTEMASAQVLEFGEQVKPVNYIHDVVYCASQGTALRLQILSSHKYYDPSNEVKGLPCVVYIQGSAWMKQSIYDRVAQMGQFASRGYVVAMVEYTHSGLAAFPAPLQDVKAAIRYMRKNAQQYGVDADNIFVWGDSSGGHLSLMAGLTKDVEAFEPEVYGGVSDAVNACVAYYPVTDIRAIHGDPCSASTGLADSPEGMLMGRRDVESCPEESDAASPITYVIADRAIPPVMLAVGTRDHIVPFSQSESMAKRLEQEGKTYQYYVLNGADHGSWEFWTEQMLDKVDAFLKSNLKP